MPNADYKLSPEQYCTFSQVNKRGIVHIYGPPGVGKKKTVAYMCIFLRKGLYLCPSYQSLHNSMDALIKDGYKPMYNIKPQKGIFHLRHAESHSRIYLMTIQRFSFYYYHHSLNFDMDGYEFLVGEELSMWSTNLFLPALILVREIVIIFLRDVHQLPQVNSPTFPLFDITSTYDSANGPIIPNCELTKNFRSGNNTELS